MTPIHLYINHLDRRDQFAREIHRDRLAAQLQASRVSSTPTPTRRRTRLVARLAR